MRCTKACTNMSCSHRPAFVVTIAGLIVIDVTVTDAIFVICVSYLHFQLSKQFFHQSLKILDHILNILSEVYIKSISIVYFPAHNRLQNGVHPSLDIFRLFRPLHNLQHRCRSYWLDIHPLDSLQCRSGRLVELSLLPIQSFGR